MGGGNDWVSATIMQRTIYSGHTPLFSDCAAVQTAPMELTIAPCIFTTTGRAKVHSVIASLPAQAGLGQLGQAIREDKAEWYGNRVRAWIRDSEGNIIERAVTYILPAAKSIIVPPGDTYYLNLIKVGSVVMDVVLRPTSAPPRPANYIHVLAIEFVVPLGTTDLSSVKIEVFTVIPGSAPSKSSEGWDNCLLDG